LVDVTLDFTLLPVEVAELCLGDRQLVAELGESRFTLSELLFFRQGTQQTVEPVTFGVGLLEIKQSKLVSGFCFQRSSVLFSTTVMAPQCIKAQ